MFYKIERKLLKLSKRIWQIFRTTKPYDVELRNDSANSLIYSMICSTSTPPYGTMVCRFGSTEFSAFTYEYVIRQPIWKRYIFYIKGYTQYYRANTTMAHQLINTLCCCSGFFPTNKNLLPRFCDLVLNDMRQIDLLGVWNCENIFSQQLKNVATCKMSALEPYDYDVPWSGALKGKKVLVVHPFADTIQQQYKRHTKLWEDPNVLPEFELKTLKAVQTLAGEQCEYKDWFEALDAMKNQMNEIDYDVAIIGCGAYGFHLAAHAKRMGKKAIHLGGATQILFGIKGKRWDENPAVNKFYNEYWVYPSAAETPQHKDRVEGGCYW